MYANIVKSIYILQ